MNLTCDEVIELAPSYVLGALDASTLAAVREHLAGCPNAHEEFAELGGLVPYLLDEPEPVAPRPELRARVLASFATEAAAAAATVPASGAAPAAGTVRAPGAAAARGAAPPAGPAPAEAPGSGHRVSTIPPAGSVPPIDRRRRLLAAPALRWGLAAAAVVAIIALAFGNLLLQGEASSARRYADNLNRALVLAAQPGSRVAVMGSATGVTAAGTPGGIAVITSNGSGILVMHDLAATQGTQVYEAWFVANEQAIPVGSFRVGADGTGVLDRFETSSAPGAGLLIGLTREPGPGATKPTLPMVAAGSAEVRAGQ